MANEKTQAYQKFLIDDAKVALQDFRQKRTQSIDVIYCKYAERIRPIDSKLANLLLEVADKCEDIELHLKTRKEV